ncbi:MAG: RDD family protein [Chthoniobacteraceae bacterium]
MENELKIQTPEGVAFSFLLAGPISRSLAVIVDLFCIGALGTLLSQLLSFTSLLSADFSQGFVIVGYFALSVGFSMFSEWLWRGQTPGKRLLGLRVIDAQGLRLNFSQIVLRNLLRPVDMLPAFYLAGGVAMLCNPRWQRLGDLAANTVVIRHVKRHEPDLAQISGGKFNSLRTVPHLAARLRQRTPPALAQVVLQALVRREALEPQARVELFHELAGEFRTLVEYPPEIVESLADEQYLRNVAEILFTTSSALSEPKA